MTIFLWVAAMVVVMRLVLTLGLGGVEEVLLTVPAEDDTGDGAVEGELGDGNCGGSADHCGDLGGAVAVNDRTSQAMTTSLRRSVGKSGDAWGGRSGGRPELRAGWAYPRGA